MKKRILKVSGNLTSIVKKIRRHEILPFSEIPSDNHFPTDPASQANPRDIGASDLFSLFTADIIRKDVKFIR